MESYPLNLLYFLLIAVVGSHAALPTEVYWNTKLPNATMPKAVRELLRSGNTGKTVNAGVNPFPNIYWYDAAFKQEVGDSDFFFLEKDLHPGKKINVYLTCNATGANFLTRQEADAIPFSSDKLSEIMDTLSLKPLSVEAEGMRETIKMCEEPAADGEDKICATSLESMIDFSLSELGKNVLPMSTDVEKEEMERQQYTIAPGVKRIGGENSVICHIQSYAYPVFSCHAVKSTKTFKVPLFGGSGRKATAVAVCHADTSKWNPEHLAYKILKVKPGVPVCHFLLEGDIVWASHYIPT